MSLLAGVEQRRGIVWISHVRINVNHSKEQFNDGTMAPLGGENKGGNLRVTPKVWVDAIDVQEEFNEACTSLDLQRLEVQCESFLESD